jgi:hypothetical protein
MMMLSRTILCFEDIKFALAGIQSQQRGDPSAICQTGEPYLEFREKALARPADVKIIEREVAQRMWLSLSDYLSKRSGTLYWRIPFEYDISEHHEILYYDNNGPDKDCITNRPCVMDKNWRKVQCYARLYRATMPLMIDERLKGKAAAVDVFST